MTIYKAKFPDEKGYIHFTEQENHTWNKLLILQLDTIQNRACQAFCDGLEELSLPTEHVPQLPPLNEKLKKTGWQLVPVEGTIFVDRFFDMLSKRLFPVANFIRIPEELHYLQQPDIFHEIFGHAPLLMNQAYADFVQWYGKKALTLGSSKARKIFSRLFWFTIEFGLLQTPQGLRIFGGGILSSHQETIYALESSQPKRWEFNLNQVLGIPYDYNVIQTDYFTIESLESLYTLSENKSLDKLLASYVKKESNDAINAAAC